MTDAVNEPAHYNKQGIEVIDVIEAYTPNSPHLANVLKYVCRHSYKGKPVQDLKKAAWYLRRAITLAIEKENLDSWEPPSVPDLEALYEASKDHIGPGYSPREVEVFFEGYDCRKDEETDAGLEENTPSVDVWRNEENQSGFQHGSMYRGARIRCFGCADLIPESTDPHALCEECLDDLEALEALEAGKPYIPAMNHHEFCSSLATRIAGEDVAAQKLKDEYYSFDRHEIQGYCASCDAEIAKGQPYVLGTAEGFDKGLKFCRLYCVKSLKAWQTEGLKK